VGHLAIIGSRKYSELQCPGAALIDRTSRPWLVAGYRTPAFPIIVECLDEKEGRKVNELQKVFTLLDTTLPNDGLAEVFCGDQAVQDTLCDKTRFWAVVIGSPGIYRTEYVLSSKLSCQF